MKKYGRTIIVIAVLVALTLVHLVEAGRVVPGCAGARRRGGRDDGLAFAGGVTRGKSYVSHVVSC